MATAKKKTPEVQKQDNTLSFAIVYAAVGFLTFGHVFNANYVPPTPPTAQKECGDQPADYSSEYWDCLQFNITAKYSGDRGTPAFIAAYPAMIAGVGWPLYWGGKIAIEVTK